jgi:ElaB/YqjD/DUF883 family membrane-anchored ribosome-binding protein
MKETSNGKESWAEAIDRARDHFNEGWKELARAGELAKEKGEEAWKSAQAKGRETWQHARAAGMEKWEDAKDYSSEMMADARERGEEVVKDAQQMVRKYPAKAVGLSVLVGIVVGVLLGRDRD